MSIPPSRFVLCLAVGLVIRPIVAASATVSFGVTVMVQASCSASVAQFDASSTLMWRAEPKVSVTCSIPTPYMIGITQPRTWDGIHTLGTDAADASAIQGYAARSGLRWNADRVRATGVDLSSGKIPAGRSLPGPFKDWLMIDVTY